jgi:hypothetical protein
MDPEENRRKRAKNYARRNDPREKVEKRSREELAKGAQRGVRPRMKRNLTPGSDVVEDVVLEWSTSEDMPSKRLGMEDTSSDSSGSEGISDEAHTLWQLCCVIKFREKRAHMCGAWAQICGVPIELEDEASHGYMLIRREVVMQYSEVSITRKFGTQCSGSTLNRREDGMWRSHVLSGKRNYAQGGSV